MIKKILIVAALAALAGCSVHSPDPGHEVVLTAKPLIFGHGGVLPEPVKTGLSITAWTTNGTDVSMLPVSYELDLPDTMSSDGVPLGFHTVLNLQVTDSVKLISKFGPGWYENNVKAPFAKIVRQAVRKHGMNETAISAAAIEEIDTEIHGQVTALLAANKLPVQVVQLTVGKANPPDAVKTQRIETASQQQRIQTEMQKKLAEDQRKMAETARAAADNAYREAMNLSPDQFVELQRISMLGTVCGEKGACTFIQGGAEPVYNLRK